MDFQSLSDQQKAHFLTVVKPAPIRIRKEKLKKIRTWIMTNRKEIQHAVFLDFRKGPEDVDLSEIKPLLAEIDHTIHHLDDWAGYHAVSSPLYLLGSKSGILHEPKGVTLIIAPWNFPFMLAVNPLISAVAAGCCAVIKPSELTPNTSVLLEKFAADLFPREEVTVIQGDASVSQSLLELKWDHIFFTGSPQVGKIVMAAASKHLTSVTLELGGQNPVVVDETANLKDAAEKLIWGKLLNNGQSCVSVNAVFVQEKVKLQLEVELVKAFEKLYPDHKNRINSGDWIRVVNERHTQRIAKLVFSTIESGAREILGGGISVTERMIPPTILSDVTLESPILKEEIFGPVMPILPYKQINEVINWMNSQEKPLMAYIFSKSKQNIQHFIDSTTSGGVAINETTLNFVHPGLPFGGVNNSGIGKAHGKAGFLAFTNERSIFIQRRGLTTMKLAYPPYSWFKKLVIEVLLKWL